MGLEEGLERLKEAAEEMAEEPHYQPRRQEAYVSVEHSCGHRQLYSYPMRAAAAEPERFAEELEELSEQPCGRSQGCLRGESSPAAEREG